MCDISHPYVSFMCGVTNSYVWHDSFACVTWLIHTWNMTHLYVWHHSFTRETHLYVWPNSVKKHIHMWGVIRLYSWRDSFMCMTWLIHMWHVTHLYRDVREHSFVIVRCHFQKCDVVHSYVTHDYIDICIYICILYINIHICIHMFIYIYIYTYEYMHMYVHMSHSNVWRDSFIRHPW